MAEVINFKVFLTRENADREKKPEIRRFGIDSDVVTNYFYFCEKLQTIFPELRERRFSITWKDSENDDIMITSCEELQVAFTEMEINPIRKLYVTLHSEYEDAKSTFQEESGRASTGPANKEKHVGIVCDGCDKDIFGFGYKCLRCVDYDLCTECEAKGCHPEHCMIRFPTPLQRKLHKGKCLFRPIDVKIVTGSTEEDSKKHSHKHRRHSGGQSYHHNQVPSWLNTLATYLNDWAHLPEECPAADEIKRQKSNKSSGCPPYPSTSCNSSAEEESAEVRVNVQPKPEEKPAEVRVKVQPKAEEKPATTETASASSQLDNVDASTSKQESVQQNANIVADPKPTAPSQEKTTTNIQQSQTQESPMTSIASEPSSAFPIPSDWTLLDKSDVPSNAAVSATLNAQKTASEVPIISESKWHPDLKIHRAVEAMIQMGFTNEGGWLTQLLVLKNGDISKVLDILQPINPKNK